MTRDFRAIHPDASVEEVIRGLKAADSDPLPVCEGDRLIGMVGYRDVAARVVAAGRRGGPARARDVIAPDVIYCLETTQLEEAVALMRDNGVHTLPVLNESLRLVGILTLATLPTEPPNPNGTRP